MSSRRMTAALLLLAAAALLLASCSRQPSSYELTIIGTSDIHGALSPTLMKIDVDGDGQKEEVEAGGMPRLASLIREIEGSAGHPVAVLSSGDELTGRFFHNFKGEATYSLMNAAGLTEPDFYTLLFGWARVAGIGAQIVDERLNLRDGKGVSIYRPRFIAEDQPARSR